MADGVVVGSALVRALDEGGVKGALDLVRELRAGLDAVAA
jgi:tryptophan synthase alpha subunit